MSFNSENRSRQQECRKMHGYALLRTHRRTDKPKTECLLRHLQDRWKHNNAAFTRRIYTAEKHATMECCNNARCANNIRYHCVPKKRPPFYYILSISVKNYPVLIISVCWIRRKFDTHEYLTHLSTSPVRCSHFTLGNPKSHFSTVLFIIFRLSAFSKENDCNFCSAP